VYRLLADSVKRKRTDFVTDLGPINNLLYGLLHAGGKNEDTLKPDNWQYYTHQSIKYEEKAIRIHPSYASAWLNKGIAWMDLHQVGRAEIAFDSVFYYSNSYPNIGAYLREVGKAYYDSANIWHEKGDMGLAMKYLLKAEPLQKKNADLYLRLGDMYFQQHDYANARENLKKCLAINPKLTDAQKELNAIPAGM
jgi:tetratricopeptide (TPR) repeat protein